MKKISLSYYGNDGKGCEYDVYENGEVTIYFMLNGIEISEVGEFNHDQFYDWVRRNSDKYDIYVSEYKQNIPDDFIIVWEQNSKKDIRNKDNVREETVEVLIKYLK